MNNKIQIENLERIKLEFEALKRLIGDAGKLVNGQLVGLSISNIEAEIKAQEKALGLDKKIDWTQVTG